MSMVDPLRDLQELIKAGRLKSAIEHGRALLENQALALDYQTYINVCLMLASILGRVESAQAEHDLLMHAEAYLRDVPDLSKVQLQVHIFYRLVYYFWNMLHYENALHWVEQALDAIGELAVPDWIGTATWLKARILYELGMDVEQQNALVLTCAGVWNSGWAADYLVGPQRLETPPLVKDLIDLAVVPNLKIVRQALYDSEKISPQEFSDLRSSLLEVWDSEDVITLGECWRLLNEKSENFGVLSNDGEYLRDLLRRLSPLRANRLRLDLVTDALRQTITDSELLGELHRLRLSLLQVQLENTHSFSYRPRPLMNYQRALSEAITSGTVSDPNTLFSYTHYTKHLDLLEEIRNDDDKHTTRPSLTHPHGPEVTQPLSILEDKRIPSSEEHSLDTEELYHRLHVENAAYLDFFIGSSAKASRLIIAFGGEAKTFPLRISRQSFTERTNSILKIVSEIAKKRITSETEAFEILRGLPSAWTSETKSLQEVFTILQRLGVSLFSNEALNFVEKASLLYLAPHHRLHTMPLHLLPIGDTPPLIYRHQVLYVPKASYLLNTRTINAKLDEPYLCVNTDDLRLGGAAFLAFLSDGRSTNHWKDTHSIMERVEELSRHRSAWFFLHGYPSTVHHYLYRLALPHGQRLTVMDVANSPGDFSGMEIYLFACGSGRPTITRASEFLGFPSAFLGKGADCVLSSLWSPEAAHSIAFAKLFIEAKSTGEGRAGAFQTATKEAMQNQWNDLRHWLNFSCFVLHGRERENIF